MSARLPDIGVIQPTSDAPPAWRRALGSRYLLGGAFALATAVTALGAFLATSPPAGELVGPASRTVLIVLGFNLILILGVAVLIGRRVSRVIDSGSGDAGARLHRRFLLLFAVAAVAPALVVALFSGALVTRASRTGSASGSRRWCATAAMSPAPMSPNRARTSATT
jgi:two-component system nitrogen regulation sensor histidine kinase NtrY